MRSCWSEPQSAPGLVFADCIQLLHLLWVGLWGNINSLGLPWWLSSKKKKKKICLQCKRHRSRGFDSWVRKIPWSWAWQSTPIFLPGKSHGQRSLAGYGSRSCKASDTTEAAERTCTHLVHWTCVVLLVMARSLPHEVEQFCSPISNAQRLSPLKVFRLVLTENLVRSIFKTHTQSMEINSLGRKRRPWVRKGHRVCSGALSRKEFSGSVLSFLWLAVSRRLFCLLVKIRHFLQNTLSCWQARVSF